MRRFIPVLACAALALPMLASAQSHPTHPAHPVLEASPKKAPPKAAPGQPGAAEKEGKVDPRHPTQPVHPVVDTPTKKPARAG